MTTAATHTKRVAVLLNGNELAIILHGLRMIQENANGIGDCMAACCDHFDGWDQLNDEEIDALCERINPLDADAHRPSTTIRLSAIEIAALDAHVNAAKNATGFDYTNQAWVKDGRYVTCGHDGTQWACNCYGRLHKDELVSPEVLAAMGKVVEP